MSSEKLRFGTWSIGLKTLCSHILLALVVVLFVSLVDYALQFRYVQAVLIEELTRQAEFIAAETEIDGDNAVVPDGNTMHIYQQLTDADVFFVNSKYVAFRGPMPLESSGTDQIPDENGLLRVEIINSLDQQFISKVLDGEEVSDIRKLEFARGMTLFVGVPIEDTAGNVAGAVVIAQPISVLHSLSGLMRILLYFSAGVSVLLATVLALVLTQILLKPIRRITGTAKRMADGEYTARVRLYSLDEIGELGSTLNALCSRLSGSIERLREERDKLDLIIKSIGEGIVAVDAQFRIVHVNKSFLELCETESAEDALKNIDNGPNKLRELLEETVQLGTRGQAEMSNPSGRSIVAIASPLFDEEGRIIGAVGLLRDVSQTQRLEQLRRDYVANISHELRTPLTGIRGMVEPLMDGYIETEAEKQDCYRVIYDETLRLEKLVGEMLDMSRLQDGRIVLELELLELPGILDASVRRMRALAEKSGICLTQETDGTPLACMGNEDRILQVLVIFLDNALSFTPEGGTVCVFGKDAGDFVIAGVRDTGAGIEQKDLPFIWERFYKADKSRLRTTGTGLGLAIAKLVVELMGGEIGVKSTVGEGSEFTFTLPKKQKER